MKNQKGVTMIALLITILLLIILTWVSLGSGYSLIKQVRIGRIISNMALVKAKAETIYEQYQFSGNEMDLVGTEVENIDFVSEKEIEMIEQKAQKGEFANWTWYEWNAEVLKSQGLDANLLGENEKFFVNYESGEIIYNKATSDSNKENYFSMTGLNYIYEND